MANITLFNGGGNRHEPKPQPIRRVGILGGSYNPGHLGHRHIAEQAHQKVGLDEVWLWVSHNIFKAPADYASPEDREDLCNLMCQDDPWLKVTTMEKDFHDTMTATSMTILAALHPQTQFTWIFGDDNFASFESWNRKMFSVGGKKVPDWQYLMNTFPIAVMFRPRFREEAKESVAAKYGKQTLEANPMNLGKDKVGWALVDNPPMDVSSTDIKSALDKKATNIENLDPSVEQEIYNRGLFGTGEQKPKNEFISNNTVRFHTFLLLASVAHTCKSAAKYNFSSPDITSYINYFDTCWEDANAQEDFEKPDKLPNQLSECLASLYHLAEVQGINLPALDNAHENQSSITKWRSNAGTSDIQSQLFENIKALAHICAGEGLEKHRALNLLRVAFEAPDLLDPATAHRNNFKVIQNYADSMGIDIANALNDYITEKKQDMGHKPSMLDSAHQKSEYK